MPKKDHTEEQIVRVLRKVKQVHGWQMYAARWGSARLHTIYGRLA